MQKQGNGDGYAYLWVDQGTGVLKNGLTLSEALIIHVKICCRRNLELCTIKVITCRRLLIGGWIKGLGFLGGILRTYRHIHAYWHS